MARFYGEVGYGSPVETSPGVWTDQMAEYPYFGDVQQAFRKLDENDSVNQDFSVNNGISIVADQFAFDNFFKIKYVRWAGVLWVVTTVELKRPRLIMRLGGVYNGPTP